METASCIVVGAGPAGVSASYHLARAGVDVLLLEAARFPRDKVCGDGLTADTLVELERLGMREAVTATGNPVNGCVLYAPGGSSFEVESQTVGYVVPRAGLDERLFRRAGEAGVRAHEGVRISDLSVGRDGVELTAASGQRYRGQMVVLATGSHCALPMRCGLQSPPACDAVARRAYFENVHWASNRLLFSYAQDLLPGYGWVFPMAGGRANVGVGYFLRDGQKAPLDGIWERFVAWLRAQGVFGDDTRPCSPVGTAQMRTDLRRNLLTGERLLVAGDAASAINPLSGEGISQALRTGRLAAEAARGALESGGFSARQLQGYAGAVRQELSDHRAYRAVRWLLGSQALVNAVVEAGRARPKVAASLYHTLIGVEAPIPAMARCAAGVVAQRLPWVRR